MMPETFDAAVSDSLAWLFWDEAYYLQKPGGALLLFPVESNGPRP